MCMYFVIGFYIFLGLTVSHFISVFFSKEYRYALSDFFDNMDGLDVGAFAEVNKSEGKDLVPAILVSVICLFLHTLCLFVLSLLLWPFIVLGGLFFSSYLLTSNG